MTFSELERLIEAKRRVKKREDKERAFFDYKLADLIGRSVSRIHSSSAKLPELTEAYPSIFEDENIEEKKQERVAELSALRFRKFAQNFNKKIFNKEVGKE